MEVSKKKTMRKGLKNIFGPFFILSILLFSGSLSAQVMNWSLEQNYESFAQNHKAMMGVAVHLHEEKSVPHSLQEGESHHNLQTLIQDLFISKAYAHSGEVCLYGGWPSFMSQNNKCVAPWNHSQNSTLMNYGPTYSQNHFCGGKNLFRCNPVLFGPGRDGRGHCVKFSNNDEISHKCYQQGKQNIQQLFELYKSDEDFKEKYQQLVVLMIGFCRENTHYTSCHALIQSAVDFQSYSCNESLDELLDEEEFQSLIGDWSNIDDHMSEILSGRRLSSDAADPTVTPAPVRNNTGGMAPIALTESGSRDYSGNVDPSPRNWNRFHNPREHMGPAPTPIEWDPLEYEMDEGEESELSENGRLKSNANNYNRLDRIAYEAYARGGSSACRAALNRAYDETEPEPIWKDLSIEERAKEIYKNAEHVMHKISQEDGTSGTNYQDPQQVSPEISPSVGACISFIETRGTLNPHAMNYTFCKARNTHGGPISTAHGLGQQTWTTFKNLRNQGLLPLTVAKQYDGLGNREAFHRMNGDVTMQMEVLLRYMNYEVKRNGSLINGVAAYDQDHQSNYLRLFRNCMSCMDQKGASPESAATCYREMN